MSKKFLVQFNFCSKSGKQLNQNLFDDLDLALNFSIQLCQCSNVEFVGVFEVQFKSISKIDVCKKLHGDDNGQFCKEKIS